MKRLSVFLIILLCCAVSAKAPAHASDPLESLKKLSDFPKIDLKRLMGGEIISQRGPLMNFPIGISSQICYFLPIAPEEMFRRLKTWDPTRCTSLKVYASSALKNPCELKEFKKLRLDPKDRPVKWLLEKSMTTTPGKSELNLTRSEARELSGCVSNDHSPDSVSSCWAKLLFARAAAFQLKGFGGVLPYETGEETLSPALQIRTMLQEQVKIAVEFAPNIEER